MSSMNIALSSNGRMHRERLRRRFVRVSERVDRWLAWLTSASHNLRSFAVLRILYGIGLLITLLPSIPERSLLWGEASFWVDPEARRRGFVTFDTLFSKSNPL